MATQVTINSGSVDSAGSLALKTNGTTTAVTINTSQGVEFNAGTAAAPTITATGDTNTGIFFPAADTIAFSEGGVESMRIDASGNVGIGTSSPTQKLQVAGKIAVSGTNPSIQQTVQNASLDLCGGTTVGTDPSIQIAGSTTTSDANKIFYNSNAHLFRSTSGGSTYATIDTSGNLLVGNTDNSNLASAQGLYLRGTGTDNCLYGLNSATTSDGVSLALFYSSFSTANQTKFEVKADGDVFSRTNSYGGFSDVRLKQGITLANSQWSDIKNIEVVKFQMKSEQFSDAENPWMLGVIAQQVEQVSPGLVDEDVKDGIKTVKYSILYMKAVKALQEAMTRIEQLEADVAALKGTA